MIYLAPNLASDRALSMKLYCEDVVRSFSDIGPTDYSVLKPPHSGKPSRLTTQLDRYIRFQDHREKIGTQ